MDHEATLSIYNVLEHGLHDETAEPRELLLSFLRAITNDFDGDQKIGDDEFSEVYKGVLRNGKFVAVKKMCEWLDTAEQRFGNELRCLMTMRAKHKNIARFLGYCAGTHVVARHWSSHWLLCFEYLSGGKLSAHITDASCGLSWTERYTIIKGICEGLCYLHQNLTVHLGLKSANIWLDGEMVPKIHDFGGSRRLEEKQSKVLAAAKDKSSNWGYMAPEFLEGGLITLKTDIYSLGFLITEILTGKEEYCVVENVLKSWADRLGTSLEDTRLEQIQVCTEIAIRCLEDDPEMRLDVEHILEMLVEKESTDEFTEPDETESVDEFTESDEQVPDVQLDNLSTSLSFGTDIHYRCPELLVQTMELNILERVLAGSEEPTHLDWSLLQSITDNFSEHRLIGTGGCGEVYKGILRNGNVAVKRLFKIRTIKDKMFHREVQNLIMVRHENIVRLLGYCSFTEEHVTMFRGRTIMADVKERLLCLEYISNGSLANHLTDELRGLEWHTRYEIIVGICKGLIYLHEEKEIIHMDLKPANILLDHLMQPKITDFGISRLDNNSQAATTSRLVSPVYSAPEYIFQGKASSKSDIYSLGVIVKELVTGSTKEPDLTKVLRRWRHRWIKLSKNMHLGYQQVTKCLELAEKCIQIDPTSRPDIVCIMDALKTIDSKGGQFQEIPCLDDMLGIEPLEIHFPFELDPQISHSIELTNDMDDYVAFMLKARLRCFCIEPNKGIVPPRSKCSVTVTMQAQVNSLPNNHYKEEITVLSTRIDGGLAAMDGTRDVFIEKEGNVVDEVNVMVVFDDPPSDDEGS